MDYDKKPGIVPAWSLLHHLVVVFFGVFVLLNVVIAVMTTSYEKIQEMADEVVAFQRFSMIMQMRDDAKGKSLPSRSYYPLVSLTARKLGIVTLAKSLLRNWVFLRLCSVRSM